jgi:hypothetical protein
MLALTLIGLLIIGVVAFGLFYYGRTPITTQSSSSSATVLSSGSGDSPHFKVNYDNLTLGFKSGLWAISIQDVSGKPVKLLTAILNTPTETKICTGLFGGFVFSNCPSVPPSSGTFPLNATFTGYASGAGPGSAVSGKIYTVTIVAVFSDDTHANDTLSVTAMGG